MDKETTRRPSIPEGLRDILPAEAKARRDLEGRLRAAFEGRAFGEVISPTFEFYDLLSVEAGAAVKRDMVRFMGSDGRLLALRPEMTTTIARVVTQRLEPEAGPHRLYYIANVFREEFSKQGRAREFWQAGIELVGGAGGTDADTEVIALFVEALDAAGLAGFQVGLGQIGFLEGALRALPVTETDRERLRSALDGRSLVEYRAAVAALGLDDETVAKLLAIPTLRGGPDVFKAAAGLVIGDDARAALDRLQEIWSGLDAAGLADRVVIDLGIWRSFDYYTGLVFEAYAPGLGVPLGSGGRYDNLLAEFGRPQPAAGFALGLERIQLALSQPGPPSGAGA
ncbi:MAG: ATP phosphoribosyltransferase regulatory subunit [Actinomycetota bacterium]|nr:ATP phosphoribosyltransferase regulatory subunit [Actinomycetota bacterium]